MDSLVAANIKQRPVRTVVSVLGVALGVVLITLNVGLARGLIRDHAEREANVQAELRFASPNSLSIAGATLTLPDRYADAILHGVKADPDNPSCNRNLQLKALPQLRRLANMYRVERGV
ncbi:MAG TPA: hypothetical protein VLZ81_09625 [Blastocatellia bacterium]|nr:hypothetical protein [Blastocatellia bacterium]